MSSSRLNETSKKRKVSETEVFQFTKSITQMTKAQETFKKSIETFQHLNSEVFGNLEIKLEQEQKKFQNVIDSKKQEIALLEEEFERKKKNGKLDVEYAVKAHKLDVASKFLSENDMTAVKTEQWSLINKELAQLKANYKSDLELTLFNERKLHEGNVASIKKELRLIQEAKEAKLQASLDQKDQQVLVLKETIKDLKRDVTAQRELTRDVAKAARPQAQVYHPQK